MWHKKKCFDNFQERCAYVTYNHKRVYMCFCKGDLCNSASSSALYLVKSSAFLYKSNGKNILCVVNAAFLFFETS